MSEIEKLMPLAFFQKGHYSGSLEGMRYRIDTGGESKSERLLTVCIWPEPYCFEKTEEEKKQYHNFPFSEEGREMVRNWLNEQHLAQSYLWKI